MAGSAACLAFGGALGAHRYPEFRGAFERASREEPLLVDLRDAISVDPTFLAELLMFQRRRRPARTAVLIQAGGDISRTFSLASIRNKIDVYDNEAAALQSLARRPFEEEYDASATGR